MPVFNANLLWLAQVLIAVLVVCLAAAAVQLTRSGAAGHAGPSSCLLRLPVTVYLGWAVLASLAGLATTLRWFGMPAQADWVTLVSLLLVVVGTAASYLVVTRLTAVAGYAFTSCWALVAVAVGTYVPAVRWLALAGLVVVVAGLIVRTARERRKTVVLLG